MIWVYQIPTDCPVLTAHINTVIDVNLTVLSSEACHTMTAVLWHSVYTGAIVHTRGTWAIIMIYVTVFTLKTETESVHNTSQISNNASKFLRRPWDNRLFVFNCHTLHKTHWSYRPRLAERLRQAKSFQIQIYSSDWSQLRHHSTWCYIQMIYIYWLTFQPFWQKQV